MTGPRAGGTPPGEHEPGHGSRRDELAAYALGALDEAEARAVEDHLAVCLNCREYVAWLDPAVDMLPESVPPIEPPRRLKRELVAAVRADAREAERAERAAAPRRRGLLGLALRPATALAAFAVAAAGLVGGYALWGGSDEPDAVIAARPAAGAPPGALAATLEVEDGSGTLRVERLPALPENRVYQAWIGRDGELEPSTPFVIRPDGPTDVAITGDLDGADAVYITREPEGGSEQPTSAVLLEAPLA